MARKQRIADDDDHHIWPGYVDALTNVIINLLFLIALFVLAILVSSFKYKPPDHLEKVDIKTISVASPGEATTGRSPIKAEVKNVNNVTLYVFSMSQNVNPAELSNGILDAYIPKEAARDIDHVDIWCSSSESPAVLRSSFLAMSVIKNHLEKIGASKNRIFTRIYMDSAAVGLEKKYFIAIRKD